jgi:hypothetical protein
MSRRVCEADGCRGHVRPGKRLCIPCRDARRRAKWRRENEARLAAMRLVRGDALPCRACGLPVPRKPTRGRPLEYHTACRPVKLAQWHVRRARDLAKGALV